MIAAINHAAMFDKRVQLFITFGYDGARFLAVTPPPQVGWNSDGVTLRR